MCLYVKERHTGERKKAEIHFVLYTNPRDAPRKIRRNNPGSERVLSIGDARGTPVEIRPEEVTLILKQQRLLLLYML